LGISLVFGKAISTASGMANGASRLPAKTIILVHTNQNQGYVCEGDVMRAVFERKTMAREARRSGKCLSLSVDIFPWISRFWGGLNIPTFRSSVWELIKYFAH